MSAVQRKAKSALEHVLCPRVILPEQQNFIEVITYILGVHYKYIV